MIIEQKTYPLMSEGQHAVVVAQVKDLGERDTAFGRKPKLVLEFKNLGGETIGKMYTASIHEKSNLYKDVKSFTGKPPVAPFEVDKLVGTQLQIIVVHADGTDGKLRANIAAFLKPALGQPSVAAANPSASVSVAPDNLNDAAIA